MVVAAVTMAVGMVAVALPVSMAVAVVAVAMPMAAAMAMPGGVAMLVSAVLPLAMMGIEKGAPFPATAGVIIVGRRVFPIFIRTPGGGHIVALPFPVALLQPTAQLVEALLGVPAGIFVVLVLVIGLVGGGKKHFRVRRLGGAFRGQGQQSADKIKDTRPPEFHDQALLKLIQQNSPRPGRGSRLHNSCRLHRAREPRNRAIERAWCVFRHGAGCPERRAARKRPVEPSGYNRDSG